jgi:hypothetical protein
VASFRKKYSTSIQLVVDSIHLIEHCVVADAFPNHFQLLYSIPSPGVFLSLSSSPEFLILSPISDSNNFKALKLLKLSKYFGYDNMTGFLIEGCSDILVPVLKHTIFLI